MAYISYVISTVIIVWLIVKLNTYRLKKDKERLEQIITERTAEIRQQNEEIQTQAESLLETNNSLIQKNEEINQQNEEIKAQAENLETANKEITQHKDKLEKSHGHITASINYARRIQNAMLPTEKLFEINFSQYFVFYQPRDIVSGDFYWFKKVNQYQIIAVADCTGHGVPGAFVSMLGISLLNEIVIKKEITRAAEVLDKLRQQIKNLLQQTGKVDEQKDGMDMALSVIDTQTNKLQFAGAHNPLYIIRNKKFGYLNIINKKLKIIDNQDDQNPKTFISIKADKQPIGIYVKERPFDNNEIQLYKNDILYMFSDGYADQFGHKTKHKYFIGNFRRLLISISEKSMQEQGQILEKTFTEWRGNIRQIDDVLVVGVKIN